MGPLPSSFTPPPPATAYSYLRLSSKRQANRGDGERYKDGFRRQIELRDRYLAENPHLTLDTRLNLHDIGVSAYRQANIAKGGTGKLRMFVDEIEAGRIAPGSYLLVESLDRVSRAEINIAQELLLRVVNNGVILVSIADNQTYHAKSDPIQFIISIVYLMRAHDESQIKSERLSQTWIRKRESIGERKLTARAPSWLEKDGDGFRLHDHRKHVVRRIFHELAGGFGRDAIARGLNRDGEPTWGQGRTWHGGVVQKITDSRAVLGEFQPHKFEEKRVGGVPVVVRVPAGEVIPDYYPPVIDRDLWDRARRVADERRLGKAPNAGGRQGTRISNLFGMVATCGTCGNPMNFRDRGPRSSTVLICSAHRSGSCANGFRIPYQDTEDAVLTWFLKLDLGAADAGEIQRLEQRIKEGIARRDVLQAEGEQIVSAFGRGDRFAGPRLDAIRREIEEVEAETAAFASDLGALRRSGVGDEREAAITRMFELIRAGAADEEMFSVRTGVRQMLRDTIASMRCRPDGHVDIIAIDGSAHVFRDGYWLHEGRWHPSGYGLFGLSPKITKAEAERRKTWLSTANGQAVDDGKTLPKARKEG